MLSELFNGINSTKKELSLLRQRKINHCRGCLYCEDHKACCVNDDMQLIYNQLKAADVIVLGTPNYYDNVPGLLKDFIDRLNPFYDTNAIRGKKIINIVVGGATAKKSQRMIAGPLRFFEELQKLSIVDSYYFKALQIGEVKNNKSNSAVITKIIKKLDSLNV